MSSVPECQGCGDYVYFGHCLCSECSDKLQTQLAEAIQAKGECVAGLIKETQKVMELTKNLGEYPEVCRQLAEAKKKIERLKESGMTEELVACDQALCDANSDNVQLTALLAEVRQGLVAQKELWDMAKINLEAYDKSMGCVPFMAVHDPIILINSLIAEIDEVTK